MNKEIVSTESRIQVGMSRTERIKVEFSDGSYIALPKRIFYRFRLKRVKTIDEGLWTEIMESLYKFELAYSMRWLGGAERSVSQIRQRLGDRKVPGHIIDRVVEYLLEMNYLSDERASEALIRSLVKKGYGPYKIKKKFCERGLQWEPALLAEIDFISLCRDEYEKYIIRHREKEPMKRKQLALNHLTRRGFSYEIIREAMDE